MSSEEEDLRDDFSDEQEESEVEEMENEEQEPDQISNEAPDEYNEQALTTNIVSPHLISLRKETSQKIYSS